MFEQAIKAGMPVICVRTDDLTSAKEVISYWSGKAVSLLPQKLAMLAMGTIFLSDDEEALTPATYEFMVKNKRQVVFLNCETKGLGFDAGLLLPPSEMVRDAVRSKGVTFPHVGDYEHALKGLSLKAVREILQLIAHKYTDLGEHDHAKMIAEVRRVRGALGQSVQGLYSLDTAIGYYEVPSELQKYIQLQRQYFLSPNTPPFLRPKGLMFAGPPGTGKTMGAKYLAKSFSVPLYRIDIASALSRWAGQSEAHLINSLALVDKEEPCVVLFDEVEKIFGGTDKDGGVIERMLSQVLWWMQDHTTRVMVVMTTNNLAALPKELYRPGRLDAVLTVPLLTLKEARALSHLLLKDLIPNPTHTMIHALSQSFAVSGVFTQNSQTFSHAEVSASVISMVKKHGWYKP